MLIKEKLSYRTMNIWFPGNERNVVFYTLLTTFLSLTFKPIYILIVKVYTVEPRYYATRDHANSTNTPTFRKHRFFSFFIFVKITSLQREFCTTRIHFNARFSQFVYFFLNQPHYNANQRSGPRDGKKKNRKDKTPQTLH